MKVRCEVDVDTQTGEFNIRFWNMGEPGGVILYNELKPFLRKIFENTNDQIDSTGFDSDDQITKEIH